MLKETLMFACGVAVGAVVIYGAYSYYKSHTAKQANKEPEEKDAFAEMLKAKEAKEAKLSELISDQTYVENLTVNELTSWFKENTAQFDNKIKMLIVIPTDEFMCGLGYPKENEIDLNKNVLQLIVSDESENDEMKVLKIRLINFTNINSNLQALLAEQNGMLVVDF